MVTLKPTSSLMGSIMLSDLALFLLFSFRPGRGIITASEQQYTPLLQCAGRGSSGSNHHPPVCSFPDDNQHCQRDEAARVRDRLTELLYDAGMPRVGGPVWEVEGEPEDTPEEQGSLLSEYSDPYVADQSGHLIITTWGDIYQKPSSLWEQRGGNPAQAFAIAALSSELEGGQCNA